MKLRLTRRALGDIGRIGNYLRDRNPAASHKVRAAIEAGLHLLIEHPHAGPSGRYGVRRLTLPRSPYLIFYRINREDDEIVVLTIRHAARKPLG